MCYIKFSMNKETIYIGKTDDITDVLEKFKSAEKPLVVLVAPEKPSVFLSSVNLKLLARTSRSQKRALVLVSPDEKVKALALENGLPVAASLKSRPVLPPKAAAAATSASARSAASPSVPASEPDSTPEDSEDTPPLDDISLDAAPNKQTSSDTESAASAAADSDLDTTDTKKSGKKSKKFQKPEKSDSKDDPDDGESVSGLSRKKKWIIFGVCAVVFLAVFLSWALIIAPKVTVGVNVRTSSSNFSESISLSTSPADEEVASGTFYAHAESLEKDQTIKFTATGQKDLGERASGTLTVYFQNSMGFAFNLPAGSEFTYKGLSYVTLTDTKLAWSGKEEDEKTACDKVTAAKGCLATTTVSVKAAAPGENYNLSAEQSGWVSKDFSDLAVYNSTAISGGTSKIVTIVQQSDIDLAIDKLASDTKEAGKAELLAQISKTVLPISASFKVETSEPKVSPAAGEEVPDGVTPQVSSKTTYSILTADLTRIEDFVKMKANLADNMRVYSIGDPFVEYFTESESGKYTAKLKTTLKTGPQISETEILDKISGQKIGRVEPILKDAFPGIADTEVNKSFFWVSSVPKDPNKVTINLQIDEEKPEEQSDKSTDKSSEKSE